MSKEVCVSSKASWRRTDGSGQTKTANNWPWSVLVLFCSAIVLVSFRSTLLLMVETWYRSRTYSHCFLILPLFVYLVWVRRKSIAGLNPAPNPWGLALLGGLGFIWLLGNLGEVKLVQELCMILILVTVVWTLLGSVIVRALIFPLTFLFFAVPFGTSLIRPLQDFTAWFVIHALTISNVPAVMEKHIISLPTGIWTVAEACSGMRFLLSSIVVGAVVSSLVFQSRKRRLIFLCASIAVPIIGNGLRAYGIIVLAYITNDRVAAGVDHIVYGGVFSIFLQLLLIIVGLRWRERVEPANQTAQRQPDDIVLLQTNDDALPSKAAFFLAAAASVIIVLTPLLSAYLWHRAPDMTEWNNPPVTVISPWRVTTDRDTSWAPGWQGTDRKFSQSYRYNSNQVDLYCVMYSGRNSVDLVIPSDGIANAKSWVLAPDGFGSAIVDGHRIKVQRSMMESGSVTRSLWTWYWVSGEYTADPARVRFLQAKARFLGRPAAVAVIILAADNQTDDSETVLALQEFLRHASFPMGSPHVS
jgi:exosortase A